MGGVGLGEADHGDFNGPGGRLIAEGGVTGLCSHVPGEEVHIHDQIVAGGIFCADLQTAWQRVCDCEPEFGVSELALEADAVTRDGLSTLVDAAFAKVGN